MDESNTFLVKIGLLVFFLKKIEIHSMQGWTATTRHGVTRKEAEKRLQDTENLFRKIQPPAPAPLKWPSTLNPPCHQFSGSASVYEISATKYVAWFTFSFLLWRQLFWNKLDGRKFCVTFLFNFVLPTLPLFLYNKEPLMRKMTLRARETFANKIISSVDPYENHDL